MAEEQCWGPVPSVCCTVVYPGPHECPGLRSEVSFETGAASRFKVKTAETFDSCSIIEGTGDLYREQRGSLWWPCLAGRVPVLTICP